MLLSLGSSARDDGITDVLAALDVGSSSFCLHAQGSRWEPLQGLKFGGPPLRPSDFNVVAVHDLSRDRMRLSWQRTFLEPLTATVDFDEIVVGGEGYISGPDIALHPQPARPMPSDRLAAVRRQQYLLNPHLLIWDALSQHQWTGEQVIRYIGRREIEGVLYGVVEVDALPRPIHLFVPVGSNYPSHLVTQENDFPCGDVEITVVFSDWFNESGIAFPRQVELRWDGFMMHRETREHVEINPQLQPDTFVLNGTLPFDPNLAERGLNNSQWIHRALAMGAPINLDAGPVVPVSLAPDVVTLGGGIHHSLAVALETGVVVVDPPQHEERSLAVIQAVTSRWPGKPITHLILTHHHHDHSGGIRAYAAIGAELIMARGDHDFIAHCLNRPHTIIPDTLATSKVQPVIRTVGEESLSLGGGAVQIYRISSPHSAEDLVVYVPCIKLLFNADLFNPGLVPKGFTPPPHWKIYSRDFLKQVEALNLDIELLLGAHGVPEGGPYQELIDFTK